MEACAVSVRVQKGPTNRTFKWIPHRNRTLFRQGLINVFEHEPTKLLKIEFLNCLSATENTLMKFSPFGHRRWFSGNFIIFFQGQSLPKFFNLRGDVSLNYIYLDLGTKCFRYLSKIDDWNCKENIELISYLSSACSESWIMLWNFSHISNNIALCMSIWFYTFNYR